MSFNDGMISSPGWIEERKKYVARDFKLRGAHYFGTGFTLAVCENLLCSHIRLGPHDAFVLFSYAKAIPDGGTYLEIGCASGGSLLCAYRAAQSVERSIELIGIDPAPNPAREMVTKEIANLTFYDLRSDDCVDLIEDNSVDLLFVDGDHGREQVRRDIFNYRKKLKSEGIMLGDNWNAGSVRQGVIDAVGDDYKVVPASNFFEVRKG